MTDTSSSFEKTPHSLKAWAEDVQLALVFLTRIPWQIEGSIAPNALNRALRAFPLIGVLVGGLSATVFGLAHGLDIPPLACAFLAVITTVLITGALHEDGLADVADGFGGGLDKIRKLEIMRDSRVGAYGVLALVLLVGLRVSLIGGFEDWMVGAAAIVGAATLSRLAPVLLLSYMEPARTDGLAATMEKPQKEVIWQAIGLACALFLFTTSIYIAIWVFLISGACLYGFKKLAEKQVGGQTGDICGASQQIVEIIALIVLAGFA